MNLEVKITKHLEKLAKKSPAVRKQFYFSPKELKGKGKSLDPLREAKHSSVKGLIHRYQNRALILLTLNCAAYCRFCFRRRMVSNLKEGILNKKDFQKIILYLKAHPKIKEVIISGGDPLTTPDLLEYFLKQLIKLKQIKIIRIGTRLIVSDPHKINQKIIQILNLVQKQALYLLLHFEHPDEITPQTREAIQKLRKTRAILLSQSVF